MTDELEYTGDIIDDENPYLPSTPLKEAVNLAIFLKRPLLIKGEPGCGKTRLAKAVSYELKLPYFEWNIKSTTRARDGLYMYDAVGRLRDAQLVANSKDEALVKRLADKQPQDYVRLGELGKAFAEADKTKKRPVVLIDEIDKADIDFPNDLLLELDQMRIEFEEELGKKPLGLEDELRPIVFITSNDEKGLPGAFLRRCLFYYIRFPDEKTLIKIINAHVPASPPELVTAAVQRFRELRTEMVKDIPASGKRVSTSELIDWIKVLNHHATTDDEKNKVLAELQGELPYPSVLLKSWDAHKRYLSQQLPAPGHE